MIFANGLSSQHQYKKISIALLGLTAIGLAGPIHAQITFPEQLGQTGAVAPTPPQPGLSPTVPGPGASAITANPFADNISNNQGAEPATPTRRPWAIVPRITVGETLTDNVAPSSGVRRSDQVTEISPGIRIDSDSARLKFHLDYQLRQLLYAQETGRRNTQNYLNSFGTLEAVEKWLFVDVSGVVAQQEISPFSFQTTSNTTVNPNRVETSSFRVSPYVRGNIAGSADYELRYNRSATRSSSAFTADVDIDEWSGKIKGLTPLAMLSWGLEGNHRNIDFSGGRNNDEDRIRGLLTYRFDPEFRVSVSAGQESNNFSTANKENHGTHGYGFDWQPSERTSVSAFREQRFFGNGHSVSIGHRTPLTALRFTDSRDVSILPSRFTTVGFGTVHDLIFTQLASRFPDPLEREQEVAKQLELLRPLGLSGNDVLSQGFLSSRVTVERRQELSYAIQWVRDVLTLSGMRSEHEGIGLAGGATDIFTNTRNIRQRGFTINYAHRLTPLTTLNVNAGKQNSRSTTGIISDSELRSLYVGVSTHLSPKTTASLGARRTLFESTLSIPYTENALVGAVTAQF